MLTQQSNVKVTFKDVGQGDCIIIEWINDENVWEIGIIDCHSNPTKNSIVNITSHLSTYSTLSFLILSHPHYDHYSGMLDLLNFCFEKNIFIESIYDSSLVCSVSLSSLLENRNAPRRKNNDLIETFSTLTDDATLLRKIFEAFSIWKKEKGTKRGFILDGTRVIAQKNITISCFSPTNDEISKYLIQTFSNPKEGSFPLRRNNPDANLLSTIVSIETASWHVLLTSDATKPSFERILKEKYSKPNSDLSLLVFQVPHHGSKENHYPDFWRKHIIGKDTIGIISAGKHDTYKHPHFEVVEFFDKDLQIPLHSTNFVYGYKEYFTQKGSNYKDLESELFLLDEVLNDDQEFDIKCGEKCINIFKDGNFEIN